MHHNSADRMQQGIELRDESPRMEAPGGSRAGAPGGMGGIAGLFLENISCIIIDFPLQHTMLH
jgi:hypothetical protein